MEKDVSSHSAADRVRRVMLIPQHGGERIDRALARHMHPLSRTHIKTLILSGNVVRCGAQAEMVRDPSRIVAQAETWQVTLPEPEPTRLTPWSVDLDVVYEDASLAVINKPAGMVVHPAAGHRQYTLAHALRARYGPGLSHIGGDARPGIVHRLDKDTSGLIVAARNDAAHRMLAGQFATHQARRGYVAVVRGVPDRAVGSIQGAIGRSRHNRQRMALRHDDGTGKKALTYYQLLDSAIGGKIAILWCRLETGRTHQIRVHCASIGHAVIGDPLYGRGARDRIGGQPFPRQALHAAALCFFHPLDGRLCLFRAPMPDDIDRLGQTLFAQWDNVVAKIDGLEP